MTQSIQSFLNSSLVLLFDSNLATWCPWWNLLLLLHPPWHISRFGLPLAEKEKNTSDINNDHMTYDSWSLFPSSAGLFPLWSIESPSFAGIFRLTSTTSSRTHLPSISCFYLPCHHFQSNSSSCSNIVFIILFEACRHKDMISRQDWMPWNLLT